MLAHLLCPSLYFCPREPFGSTLQAWCSFSLINILVCVSEDQAYHVTQSQYNYWNQEVLHWHMLFSFPQSTSYFIPVNTPIPPQLGIPSSLTQYIRFSHQAHVLNLWTRELLSLGLPPKSPEIWNIVRVEGGTLGKCWNSSRFENAAKRYASVLVLLCHVSDARKSWRAVPGPTSQVLTFLSWTMLVCG